MKTLTILLTIFVHSQLSLAAFEPQMEQALANKDIQLIDRAVPSSALLPLYEQSGFSALFVDENGPNLRAEALIVALEESKFHGLNPADYLAPNLEQLWESKLPEELVELELLLAQGLIDFSRDLAIGRTDPLDYVKESYGVEKRALFDFYPVLLEALQADPAELGLLLNFIAPSVNDYQKLYALMHKLYKEMDDHNLLRAQPKPTLEPLIYDGLLKQGASNPLIPKIKERLQYFGDYEEADLADPKFDMSLYYAVMSFQKRRGLSSDGIIGKNTLDSLNLHEPLPPGPEERIKKVTLNMEKLRWLPRDLGDRYVMVKQGISVLRLINKGRIDLKMKVIVGQPKRPTPMIFDDISYVIMRPYWTVPKSIARRDKMKQGRAYLERNNYYLIEYDSQGKVRRLPSLSRYQEAADRSTGVYLRQPPGPENALGLIQFKFESSSQSDIYMHDTNARSLFGDDDRFLSSGCIRLEKPFDFGAYLMRDTKWNPYTGGVDDKSVLEQYVNNTRSKAKHHVNLPSKIRAYVLYITAEVNEEGEAVYSDDPYGIDAELSRTLGL